MSENPYLSPQTPLQNLTSQEAPSHVELASRWARLGASLLDAIIMMVIFMPIVFVVIMFGFTDNGEPSSAFIDSLSAFSSSVIGNVLMSVMGIVIYIAINGYLLSKYGQSVGKKILGIRVVDYQTQQLLSFGRVVGLRYVLITVLTQIPLVGGLFGLVNVLFIFGSEKRCIHDLIAGSSVIKATSL